MSISYTLYILHCACQGSAQASKRGPAVTEAKEPEKAASPAKKEEAAAAAAAKPKAGGLWAKFAAPQSGWQCSSCLVDNDESAVKCVACATPRATEGGGGGGAAAAKKPTAAAAATKKCTVAAPAPAAKAGGLWATFAAKTSGWQCAQCMVDNDDSAEKCVACESPNPDFKGEPKSDTAAAAAGGAVGANGFTFGTGEGTAPAADGFVFGGDAAPAAGGFVFGGGDADAAAAPAAGGFVFGDAKDADGQAAIPAAESGFQFGASDAKAVGEFKFGTE